MSRTLTSARVILALAFAGFGLKYLRILPTIGPPWHRVCDVIAAVLGILLLAAAVGLLLRATAHFAAWVMACYFSIRFWRAYVLHLPLLLANRHDRNMWNAFGGLLALTDGMWMLSSLLPASRSATPAAPIPALAAGRYIFAAPLVIFGILHFKYAFFISMKIPKWIPERFFFANFVGLCFICAALAIVTGIRARVAAYLLATMFLLWVAILHAPRVALALHNGNEWTSMFIALTMAGSALVVAAVSPSESLNSVQSHVPTRQGDSARSPANQK